MSYITVSNLFSGLRIVFAPLSALLLLKAYYLTTLFLFTFACATDFFDGYFARKFNNATDFGAFIDPLADKILFISMLGAFFVLGTVELWVILVIVARDVCVTLLRVISLSQGHLIATSGPAKLKTSLQFVLIYFLFLLTLSGNNFLYFALIKLSIYGIAGFTLWTGIAYFIANRWILWGR